MRPKSALHYELVAKMVFEEIHRRSDLKTIEVQHNVKLQGLKGLHQIDLYWSFEQGGVIYTAVVQVKNWQTPVNQGELLKFSAVLDDLPNQPRGIFVTRSGYQKGAKDIAESKGILLYELNPVSKTDPKKDINVGFLHFTFSTVEHNQVSVVVDEEWLRNRSLTIQQKKLPTTSIVFFDQHGNKVGTLTDLLRTYNTKPTAETRIFHKFENPTFCGSGNEPLVPAFKVIGFKFILSPKEWSEQRPLIGPDVVGFILENVTQKTSTAFDWNRGLVMKVNKTEST